MDLTPWTGANLLYGTGPYVLTSGTTGVQYVMQAYQTGLTYGGLTEKNSYYWQPVRVADTKTLGADPTQLYYAASIPAIIKSVTLTNVSPYNVTVSVTGSLTPYWMITMPSPPHWSAGSTVAQTQTGIVMSANSNKVVYFKFALTPPANSTFMIPQDDLNITITAFPITTFVGRTTSSLGSDTNHWSYYTNGIAVINLAKLGADIAGGQTNSPYYGADGTVGAKDLHLLGREWGLSSVGATPTSNVARADINGDGVVDTKDVHLLGAQWSLTWSVSAQPTVPFNPYSP